MVVAETAAPPPAATAPQENDLPWIFFADDTVSVHSHEKSYPFLNHTVRKSTPVDSLASQMAWNIPFCPQRWIKLGMELRSSASGILRVAEV